jgi:hypothetical protein
MKVLGLLRANKESEAGTPPTPEQMKRMISYMEEVTAAGVLVSTNGLEPSSKGLRVTLSDGGEVKVNEGPFSSKELVASYALLEVKDMQEAVEWTRRFLQAVGGGECELRPVFDPTDLLRSIDSEGRFKTEQQRH